MADENMTNQQFGDMLDDQQGFANNTLSGPSVQVHQQEHQYQSQQHAQLYHQHQYPQTSALDQSTAEEFQGLSSGNLALDQAALTIHNSSTAHPTSSSELKHLAWALKSTSFDVEPEFLPRPCTAETQDSMQSVKFRFVELMFEATSASGAGICLLLEYVEQVVDCLIRRLVDEKERSYYKKARKEEDEEDEREEESELESENEAEVRFQI